MKKLLPSKVGFPNTDLYYTRIIYMGVSRREFIKLLVGATFISIGVNGCAPLLNRLLSESEDISEDVLINTPGIPTADSHPIENVNTIVSLVPAIFIMRPPEKLGHYESMIQVRSEISSSVFDRYQNAAEDLESRARNAADMSFVDLNVEERRSLIMEELQMLGAEEESGVQKTIRDLIRLFLFTDAYIVAGYADWPGSRRGLETYRMPPTT